jgi:homoserine O-acetyltransferase/O-succinyltransferase
LEDQAATEILFSMITASKSELGNTDGPAKACDEAELSQGVWTLPKPLSLHFGGALQNVRLAWQLVGPVSAPVVLALGGISAGRHVAAVDAPDQPKGWWKEVVGADCALDTRRFRILGIDYLSGSGETTGPRVGETGFPSISAYDQVELIRQLLTHLGIKQLQAVVGASYGGMVALALAERFPQLTRRIVVMSAAHRTHPMATAWRSVQRAVVRYAAARGEGAEGLRLARALAMATYRSPAEFAQRFGGEPQNAEAGWRFPVENYLFARGQAYAESYVPEAFTCLSESIDLHRVDPDLIRVPTTLVAVREDQLVPLADMLELRDRLAGPVEFVEISSLYGHDAFLKEAVALRAVFSKALAESSHD